MKEIRDVCEVHPGVDSKVVGLKLYDPVNDITVEVAPCAPCADELYAAWDPFIRAARSERGDHLQPPPEPHNIPDIRLPSGHIWWTSQSTQGGSSGNKGRETTHVTVGTRTKGPKAGAGSRCGLANPERWIGPPAPGVKYCQACERGITADNRKVTTGA